MGTFTIARKIFACLLIIIAGYLGAMIFGYVYGTQFEVEITKISGYWFPSAQRSQSAKTAFDSQVNYYENAVVFGDEDALNSAVIFEDIVVNSLRGIRQLSLENGVDEKKVEPLIIKTKLFIEKAQKTYKILVDVSEDSNEAIKNADQLRIIKIELKDAFRNLANEHSELLKNELLNLGKLSMRFRVLSLIVFFCVVIGSTILVFFIVNRSVTRPLSRTVNKIKEIAKGDFSIRFNLDGNDEIGMVGKALDMMAESMEKRAMIAKEIAVGDLTSDVVVDSANDYFGNALKTMLESLNNIVSEMHGSAGQVASGSSQIAESSNILSDGASRQAAALQEISSSMVEIGVQTKSNAENSTYASRLVVEAQNIAKSGVEKMNSMALSMNAISESSGKISKINKTIDAIAFQTNLLALNAAVEAARAGKHGKGFAVVAQEVRNLAARSTKAAQETTELIEDSLKKIYEGNETAANTVAVLKEIEEGVTKVADIVMEIASASNEQAENIALVNSGLEKIEEVTQQNTASAEETSAASEELSAQAAYVRKIVGGFNLKKVKKKEFVRLPPVRKN